MSTSNTVSPLRQRMIEDMRGRTHSTRHSRSPIGIDTASNIRSSKQVSITFPPFPLPSYPDTAMRASFGSHSPAYCKEAF
jgi:hypothetical protein